MNPHPLHFESAALTDFIHGGGRILATPGLARHGLPGEIRFQSLPDLEHLDRALAEVRTTAVVIEVPGGGGGELLPLHDAVHLARSARVRLCLITSLALADFRVRPVPDLLLCREGATTVRVIRPDDEVAGETPAETDRRRRQAAAAMTLARELAGETIPFRYPGWPTDPLHKRARRLLCGYGNRVWIPENLARMSTARWTLAQDENEEFLPVVPGIPVAREEC